MDLVHLGHQNAQGKLMSVMSRLGNQFIAAEGGIRNFAGAVSILQRRTSYPVKHSAFLGLMLSSHVETRRPLAYAAWRFEEIELPLPLA